MSERIPPGPPPRPPADLDERPLPLSEGAVDAVLYRIHRTRFDPLYFGRRPDPIRRQRWDAPDAGYGVCYLASESHIAFAETMLRDLSLDSVQQEDLHLRSLALVQLRRPLRLVADASVVQGSYAITGEWSAALHAHRDRPDGIRYRARHDDSGLSVALFDRSRSGVVCTTSTPLSHPSLAAELAGWLDRYRVGLTP